MRTIVAILSIIMPQNRFLEGAPSDSNDEISTSPAITTLPTAATSAASIHNTPTTTSPEPCPLDTALNTNDSEEDLLVRVERLGRERPPVFKTLGSEIMFVFSVSMSQFITEYFVSGFVVILPVLIRKLEIPQGQHVWPATAFSLVIASTLLIFGRLGDIWGGYWVFLWGLTWLVIWSLLAGFSVNPLMLDLCRALQGLGAAAILPSGVMLMGSLYRPGPRKNLVFAIYGTSAVLGFFGGIFSAGIVGQFLLWGWYFWFGGILAAIIFLTSIFSIPARAAKNKSSPANNVKMDYPGAFAITAGLVLTVLAITQSAHAPSGWRTPYIPVCFSVGILCLFSAMYIETRISEQPLLPSSIFTTPAMTPLLFALFLLYGVWGIYSVYGTLYFQNILGASPLQVVAWYVPLSVAGLLFSILEGFILHLVPGRILLVISGLSALGSQLLLAFLPLHPQERMYWAWIFPAMILSTIGIDFPTILSTVFITTKFPSSQQGLAGSVINSVLQLGVAFVVGLTDIVQSGTVDKVGLGPSYKYTFWFGVGASALSLLVMGIWAEVPKATSELTADERAELIQEATREDDVGSTAPRCTED